MVQDQGKWTQSTGGGCSVSGYALSLIDPATLDSAMVDAWEGLARDAAQPNPFFAPWFLRPAITWLDTEKAVRLLVIHDAAGELAGLMPVVVASRYMQVPLRHLSVWKNKHLYTGTPLVRRGHACGAMRALVAWVGSPASGIYFLNLTQLTAPGPITQALRDACDEGGRVPVMRRRVVRAALNRGHDFEALMSASYTTKKRAELRRRFRRFDEGGAVSLTESLLAPGDVPALSAAFLDLEKQGWKGESPDGFALAKVENEAEFFRDMLRSGAAGGHVVATVLSRDGIPAAIGLTLRCGEGLFGFKTAFDREQARFSPGIRIFHETTRRMLADSTVATYDSCAMPDHPVINSLWPDRLDLLDLDIPAKGKIAPRLLHLATQMAQIKDQLSAGQPERGHKSP